MPQPPLKLSEFKASHAGSRARAAASLLAALETASELRFTAIEAVFAGLDPRGGGLRGGSYEASDAFEGGANVRDYEYVPGVRLSGHLKLGFTARQRPRAASAARSTASWTSTRAGREWRARRRARSATGARGPAQRASGARIPQIPRALLRAGRRRRGRLAASGERVTRLDALAAVAAA